MKEGISWGRRYLQAFASKNFWEGEALAAEFCAGLMNSQKNRGKDDLEDAGWRRRRRYEVGGGWLSWRRWLILRCGDVMEM